MKFSESKKNLSLLFLVANLGVAQSLRGSLAKKKPQLGWNSWNCYGGGVTSADLRSTADYFVSSGLAEIGYTYVITDDGWSSGRDSTTGEIIPDPNKFPDLASGDLAAYIHGKNLKLGIYSAASSVVCSGRVGSLYHEVVDAVTFGKWGVDYVKYDNCGEYALGNARFVNFADAVNMTGVDMFISTEPFLIVPNPSHATFSNSWRTTNDISASFSTILDRADTNDKWADMAVYGINDPDMLEVNNGGLTDGECRAHFGIWSMIKAPLILGTNLSRLTPSLLSIVSNKDLIAINQDDLGIQAKKLAVDGVATPRFVGLAPCDITNVEPGFNGVTVDSIQWTLQPTSVNSSAVMIKNTKTSRCLAISSYWNYQTVPLLFPCNVTDPSQAWILPKETSNSIGGILSLQAVLAGTPSALTVGDSTLYGKVQGGGDPFLPDSNYGLTNLTLTSYAPEPFCNNRNCDNYIPGQMWYWSPRLQTLSLGHMSANDYRCFGPNCYQLTSHPPTGAQYCLSHVLSYDANVGTDPNGSSKEGSDVWGGAVTDGFVFGLVNRYTTQQSITARWSWLEAAGVDDTTSFCVTELYSGNKLGANVGGIVLPVPGHDMLVLKLMPGTSC